MSHHRLATKTVLCRASWFFVLVAAAAVASAQESSDAARPTDIETTSTAVMEHRSVPADTLTLEETIEAALRHSPDVVRAAGTIRSARAAERSATGAFLPDLSLTTGASLASSERFNSETNTVDQGSSDSYSAGLASSVEVFTGGRRGAELRRARAETGLAQAQLEEQRYGTVLTAKTAFFDVLRAEELIRVAEARVLRAREGILATSLRLGLGAATLSDSLRGELELTNARQQLLDAEAQYRTATYALGRLAGTDGPVAADPAASLAVSTLAVPEPDLQELAAQASPAIRADEAALRSSEASARAARAQYFPSVRLSGGYDWFNQDLSLTEGRDSWAVRLGLSYPLFDRFTRNESVTRAEAQREAAQAQLADTRRAVRAELERLLAALELAEQRIALAEQALAVAQEDLRVQRERYRVGASTILDQIVSQLSLSEAELELVDARYDHQIARAELEALVGREL